MIREVLEPSHERSVSCRHARTQLIAKDADASTWSAWTARNYEAGEREIRDPALMNLSRR